MFSSGGIIRGIQWLAGIKNESDSYVHTLRLKPYILISAGFVFKKDVI
jgi:hypothetical protein